MPSSSSETMPIETTFAESSSSDSLSLDPQEGNALLNDSLTDLCLQQPNDTYPCLSDEDYLDLIEDYIFPTPYEWVFIGLHVTVFAVGLVGNALVCLSVYRNHSMRTVTNYFIVNLAVADFLVILVCLPPTVLWDVTETWFLGSAMCKVVLYFQGVSVSVSILTLTFISLDRWYAICHPLKFKSTTKRARFAIFFIWTISLAIVVPDLVVLNTSINSELRVETHYFTDCGYTWSENYTRVYQLCIVILLYVTPFTAMAIAYYQIAIVLWNKNIPGSSESNCSSSLATKESSPGSVSASASMAAATVKPKRFNLSRKSTRILKAENSTLGESQEPEERPRAYQTSHCEGHIKSRRKAAKMLISVCFMFGLCYFPVHLINTLRYTVGLPQNDVTTIGSLVSHWLCYANSAINPIIYNFMSGKFRKEFKDAFTCACLRKRPTANRARGGAVEGAVGHGGGHPVTTLQSRRLSNPTQFENINLRSFSHHCLE